MWRGALATIGVLVWSLVSSVAAEPLSISCGPSLQAPFTTAAAIIETNPNGARRMFQTMQARHPDCAILYWGLAETTTDQAVRHHYFLEAVYWGAVSGANEAEWQMISSLQNHQNSNVSCERC
jgi:hypothetical protein